MMFEIAKRSEGYLMTDCTKCGVQLKDGARFCAQCGAAVSYCPKCGQRLKDGARFCAGCGAPVSESSSQADVPAYPPAPYLGANPKQYPIQAPTATAWVNFTVVEAGGLFGQITNTIVVDGHEVRTVQVGETIVFEILAGKRDIQLVQVYRSVGTLNMALTRKSNLLELTVQPGAQVVVVAEYGRILGKFSLSLR
jgi:Double zinc ribbon